MFDTGGAEDPSFYDNNVQLDESESSHERTQNLILDESIPLTQQSRRLPEWPTLIDNSLGISPGSSNGRGSDSIFIYLN